MPSPKTLAADLRANGWRDLTVNPLPYFRNTGGWRWGFSRDRATGVCVFSAQLVPVGRGSVLADWALFGGVCGELEMPEEALTRMQQQVADAPDSVIKTFWKEPAA